MPIVEILAEEILHRWATENLGLSCETLGRILLDQERRDEAYDRFARTVAVQGRFFGRNRDDVAVRSTAVTTRWKPDRPSFWPATVVVHSR